MTRPRPALALLLAPLLAAPACDGGASAASPWPAPPTLEVDLRVAAAPTEVALLQPVTVTVDRYRRPDVEVTLELELAGEDWVEEARVEAPEVPLGDGLWQRTRIVLLPVRASAELQVPGLRAEGAAAAGGDVAVATTDPLTVRVTSVLGEEHGAAIEAPGDVLEAPITWWPWAAGAAALGACLWLLARRRRGRADVTVPVAVDLPAHVRALRELRRWRAASRATPAEVEAFYVGVSQVLRVYLEERFGLRAPERTTEEFLRDLERGDGLARRHRAELERFLSQCDMVKFARLLPAGDEHERTFALAEGFVESTRSDRRQGEGASA